MRITGVFNVSEINKMTLHEYSLYRYAYELRQIEERKQFSYSALFNRISQGLEGKASIADIYDSDQYKLSLFGQQLDDVMTQEEKEKSDKILEWNRLLEGR